MNNAHVHQENSLSLPPYLCTYSKTAMPCMNHHHPISFSLLPSLRIFSGTGKRGKMKKTPKKNDENENVNEESVRIL